MQPLRHTSNPYYLGLKIYEVCELDSHHGKRPINRGRKDQLEGMELDLKYVERTLPHVVQLCSDLLTSIASCYHTNNQVIQYPKVITFLVIIFRVTVDYPPN